LREPESDLTEDAVSGLCKELLANYKVPKTIEIVDTYPLLPNGKMDRPRLREIAIEKYQPDAGG